MKRVASVLALIICLIWVLGPLNILIKSIFPVIEVNKQERMHMNTNNTTRILGETSMDIAMEISKVLFPGLEGAAKPSGYILVSSDKWQDVLSLLPVAKKYNITILPVELKHTQQILTFIRNSIPMGINSLNGVQLLVAGNNLKGLNTSLKLEGYKTKFISYSTRSEMQNKLYSLPGILKAEKFGFLISDENALASIPVGAWIMSQGGALMFMDKNHKLYSSSRNLISKTKLKKIYVIGNNKLINEELKKLVKVDIKLIPGYNAEDSAIHVAKFYDKENSFGLNSDRNRLNNNHNFILASRETPILAALSTQLAMKGKVGPLLWTASNRLSPLTENYLWRMKPNYWVTPGEGPYNNVWIIGDNNLIDYSIEARVDFTQEIQPYETLGEQGVSGLDVLSIISILMSILGGVWVSVHCTQRMKHLSILTKFMWILASLLLGPIGLWIYIISYINSPWMKINNKVVWRRPLWKQAAVATMKGTVFGSGTIISVAYLLYLIGLPIISFSAKGGLFLFGNPMIILMIISYILAFSVNAFIFMPSFSREMKSISYKVAVKQSIPVVIITVSALALGMMISMWWLHMVYAPVMPRSNNILWWGFMQLSIFIGYVIAYIPNWWMVRYGKKVGTV